MSERRAHPYTSTFQTVCVCMCEPVGAADQMHSEVASDQYLYSEWYDVDVVT